MNHHEPLAIASHARVTGALFAHRASAETIRDRLGGGNRHTVIEARPGETIREALTRKMLRLTLTGAASGAVVLALLVGFGALAAGLEPGTSAGIGAAIALTGGPFFGALTGFSLAVVRSEALEVLLPHLPATRGGALLVIHGSGRPAEVELQAAMSRASPVGEVR